MKSKLLSISLGAVGVCLLCIPIVNSCSKNSKLYFSKKVTVGEYQILSGLVASDMPPITFDWDEDFSQDDGQQAAAHLQRIYDAEFIWYACSFDVMTYLLRTFFVFVPLYDIPNYQDANVTQIIKINKDGLIKKIDIATTLRSTDGHVIKIHMYNQIVNISLLSAYISTTSCTTQFDIAEEEFMMNAIITVDGEIYEEQTLDFLLMWNHALTPNFIPQELVPRN